MNAVYMNEYLTWKYLTFSLLLIWHGYKLNPERKKLQSQSIPINLHFIRHINYKKIDGKSIGFTLYELTSDYVAPSQLTLYGSVVKVGYKNIFMDIIHEHEIKYNVSVSLQSDNIMVELVIYKLKKSFYWIMGGITYLRDVSILSLDIYMKLVILLIIIHATVWGETMRYHHMLYTWDYKISQFWCYDWKQFWSNVCLGFIDIGR